MPNEQDNHKGQLSWTDSEGTMHERCKLLFFAGGDFLGESPFDPGDSPELGYRRGGVLYVCPHCGEIWGRVVLDDSSKHSWFQEIAKVSCERHPDQWEVPGSFLSGYRNDALLKYLPNEAVKREFLIYTRQGEEA